MLISCVESRIWAISLISCGVALAAPPSISMGAARVSSREIGFRFEPNRGQLPADVAFSLRASTFDLALTTGGNRIQAGKTRVTTTFLNARRDVKIAGVAEQSGKLNYLLGSESAGWVRDVPSYSAVRYSEIYAGIDLVFRANPKDLEYDFVVQPGFDPRAIAFKISGARRVRLAESGDLVLETASGEIRWKRPTLYQDIGAERRPVEGGFQLGKGGLVRFRVGAFDPHATLVIDPTLLYSTYLGGSGNEAAKAVAVDAAGNTYITGFTTSLNFPVTPGALQPGYGGESTSQLSGDAFVAKFSSSGALVYLTFLGGRGDDVGYGIAVDSSGNAYITGSTNSNNFPVVSPIQATYRGSGGNPFFFQFGDIFVTKLNAAGNQIIYSTYLGGSADDAAMAIALDPSGAAYITGFTLSQNFPMVNPIQAAYKGGGGQPPVSEGVNLATGDGFILKLAADGSKVLFSTYLGGSLDDLPMAIALDSAQNIYVGGYTISHDFPLSANAFQKKFAGSDIRNVILNYGDTFVTKINSTGTAIVYSTYVGGSGDEMITSLAVDSSGAVYATGCTTSADFPVSAGAFQKNYQGPVSLPFFTPHLFGDAFAFKLSPDGASLVYSTHVGGSQDDVGMGIVVDGSGNAYIAGFSNSTDFPVTSDAYQNKNKGNGGQGGPQVNQPLGDGFLAQVSAAGDRVMYSTFVGGEADDGFTALASDAAGNLYAVGTTISKTFPVTSGAAFPAFRGTGRSGYLLGDAMLVKFSGGSSGITISSVKNAASYAAGTVSPGMLALISGSGLGPAQLAVEVLDPLTGLVATTLAGSTFTFNGIPAPVFYTRSDVAVAIVPYALQPGTTAQVVAKFGNVSSAPFTVNVAATVPGLFSADASGSGQGAIYNDNFTPNSASNPAASGGTIVFFGTGEGQTNPPGVDGSLAAAPYPAPAAPMSVTIGGLNANVVYFAAIPGEVAGLFQVNAVVPPGLSGIQPVQVIIGSGRSQTNLTVALK